MNLKRLEIFCKVKELKSFSKAAKVLYLSQPTLSMHIKLLEESFELKLFDRLGREVVATKAGEVLYEYAKKILSLVDETKKALEVFKERLCGELNIGASTIPGEYILPSILPKFKEKFPNVSLNLRIGDTKGIISDVLENRVELGVVGAKLENPKLEYYSFSKDKMVLISSPDVDLARKKRIDLDELKDIPFVLREEGSGTRIMVEKILKKAGLDLSMLKVVSVLGSTRSVIEAVKSGIGFSIVSERAVREEISHGTLKVIEIDELELLRDFYIVLRRGKERSPTLDAFLSFLLKN